MSGADDKRLKFALARVGHVQIKGAGLCEASART